MMTKRQREYTLRPNDSLTQLVQLLAALVCLSQLLSWLLLAGTALPKALGWLELSDEVFDSLAGVVECAGTRAIIINAPGSEGGASDTIEIAGPLLQHLVEQLDGADH